MPNSTLNDMEPEYLMSKLTNKWLKSALLQINPKPTLIILLCLYIVCLALTYITFVAPGSSYIEIWLGDVMGLLDIANLVHLGQTPYKDFHLIYGPLVALITGWGLNLGLNAGAIFGFNGLVVAAFLLLCVAIILPRRLTASASVFVFVLIWLLTVVPLGDVQRFGLTSWGTFYNRQGWAALIIILLFYIEPTHTTPNHKWLDSTVLAFLVLFEIYNKFTFGVVALGFITINTITSRYNRQLSLRSLLTIIFVSGILEIIFNFHLNYINDVIEAAGMVDAKALNKWQLISILISNSPMIISSIGATIAVWITGCQSKLNWLFVAGTILATVFLRTTIGADPINGTITLVAIFVGFSELARRLEISQLSDTASPMGSQWNKHTASLGCLFLAVSFSAVELTNRLITWHDFASKIKFTQPLPDTPERLKSILVSESTIKRGGDLSTIDYMKTIIEGTNLLISLKKHDQSVLTFDMVNLFPYAADMKPPKFSRPLFWINGPMTADPKRLPTPELFIGDVDYVMVPHKPYKFEQLSNMQRVYGPYLYQNYTVLAESASWQLWARRKS